jgi:hypothetical protein
MPVFDPGIREALRKSGLGEAGLAREWRKPDIDEYVNIGAD